METPTRASKKMFGSPIRTGTSPLTIVIMVAWIASIASSAWVGFDYGTNNEIAKQAKLEQAIEAATKAAIKGAAIEIAKIRVRNTTIQGRVQTIVKDNPVYRDCSHDDATLRMLNDTITGVQRESSDSSLPRAVSPKR
jgi:hypothetical protein